MLSGWLAKRFVTKWATINKWRHWMSNKMQKKKKKLRRKKRSRKKRSRGKFISYFKLLNFLKKGIKRQHSWPRDDYKGEIVGDGLEEKS